MHHPKNKICLVIPSLQSGGMERVMSILAWHFAGKTEIDLHLIIYGKNREIFYSLPQDISIHKPKYLFEENRRFWFTIKTLNFLRKEINKIKPDTILSFGEYWNSFVLLTLLGTKYPVFISDRCQPDKVFGTFHTLLRKWLYPLAAGIIAQSNVAKEIYLQHKLNPNIISIGNPIRLHQDPAPDKKENIILSVGRLISTKHHDELIKLFAKIDAPDWKLIVVGTDALQQKNSIALECLVKSLNLEERVILAGQIKDIDAYYHRSKIFAFTSSSEGFPNVIGEAQSAGLPVVAFDCIAGPSDLINDGENGFLVPLFDYDTFSQRLTTLINDQSLRTKLGNRAKETIQLFSDGGISEKYFNTITSV